MKYIVIKVDQGRIVREIPIVFPDDLVHKEVLTAVRTMRGFRDVPCVSAGFISSLDLGLHPVHDGGVRCYGNSESIGVASRGVQDSELLREMDFSHGVVADDGSVKRMPIRDASEPKRVVGQCSTRILLEAQAAADALPNASDALHVERCQR